MKSCLTNIYLFSAASDNQDAEREEDPPKELPEQWSHHHDALLLMILPSTVLDPA